MPTLLQLDPTRIVSTIATLRRRIEERFPDSGLGRLCGKLLSIGEQTREHLERVAQPILWLRAGSGLLAGLIGLLGLAVLWAAATALSDGFDGPLELLATIESGIQDIVFVGITLAFLVTAENRIKRRRALEFLRELRAMAHIVDMHQLTKDPDRLIRPILDTESSPVRTLTHEELGRYLDYCSEMLSLISKLAALYAERLNDAVVLQAVDEVEALTNGLSRKIWQKIMILDQHPGPRGSGA